jgi:RAB protein geranylgeranyltransferase component A
MSKITFEDLSYLTTPELWRLMAYLKIPYCEIEDVEKENMSTGEKVIVPKFIPRTDYENMKSDVIVAMSKLNRDFRRPIELEIGKLAKKRKKLIPKEMIDNG